MAPTPKLRLPKLNAQPGPAPGGSGAGRDTPQAGRERGVFEKERQGRGTGVNRPPVYTPKDDGERGGYVGRSRIVAKKSMALGGGGRFAAFVSRLEAQGKSPDSAKAIAASAGRAKYGAERFNAMAAKGRKRA